MVFPKINYQGPLGFKKKAWKQDEALALLETEKGKFDEEKLMITSVHASKFWFGSRTEKCPKFDVKQLTLRYDKDDGQMVINFCLGSKYFTTFTYSFFKTFSFYHSCLILISKIR